MTQFTEINGCLKGHLPEDELRKALVFVSRLACRGGVLQVAVNCDEPQPRLDLVVSDGQRQYTSPALSALARGLGILPAARLVVTLSRHANARGSIGFNPLSLDASSLEGWDNLHSGDWAPDYFDQ